MRKYDKAFMLERYAASKSFKLTEDMIDEDVELVVGSIDIPITTRCNLRCKHCGNLMPLYKKQLDIDLDVILRSLERFFQCVDKVVRVNVLGGEPFLYPHMAEVIEYLNQQDRVVRVIIATNGTVVPKNERLFEALKHSKNQVRISHYEAYDQTVSKLIDKMTAMKIDYSMKRFGANEYLWYDFGAFEDRGRSDSELKNQYQNCIVEWYSLLKGRLYPCPRAAHGVDLGLIEAEGNFVDCLDESIPLSELKKQLQEFVFERTYYPSCQQCDRGTGKCPIVPVAEQMKA